MSRPDAILLVGHGTRDARGAAEFLELARRLGERFGATPVRPCFLELVEPTIDAAVAEMVATGVRRIVVAPVLLFAAGHAKRDIPAAVQAAIRHGAGERRASGEEIAWVQTEALECHPTVLALSTQRYAEALAGFPRESEDTCLVLVGRGSCEADATNAMRRFAAMRGETSGAARCETAFIAMAEPKYPDVLRAAGERGHARIVVQPHLLFEGELLAKLRGDVAQFGRQFPDCDWRVANHLGPDELLVDAVESLCRAAIDRCGTTASCRSTM